MWLHVKRYKGSKVPGSRFRVSGFWFLVSGSRFLVQGSRFNESVLILISGSSVQAFKRSRVQGFKRSDVKAFKVQN
jgi:hypothetical protein